MQVQEAREWWEYNKANWKQLKRTFHETDWSFVTDLDVDAAQRKFTNFVLETARRFIPVKQRVISKSSHPWLNDRCLELVRSKRGAEGTADYQKKAQICSEKILDELQKLPWSSKTY